MNNNKFTLFSDFERDKPRRLFKILQATKKTVAGSPTSCCTKRKKMYKIRGDFINRKYN